MTANSTPIDANKPDYKTDAWEQYTMTELGGAIAFFTKRAGHRANKEKAKKDLADAENYLWMLQQKVAKAKQEILGE